MSKTIGLIFIGILLITSVGYTLWVELRPTPESPTEMSLKHLQQRAQEGEATAQYQLAEHYFKGEQLTQDQTQAAHWIRQAAKQGHTQAQYTLAQMYREGKGMAQDSTQAYHWYQQAAQDNFLLAQYNLGVMNYRGDGVAQDLTQAYQWFAIVAAQGQEDVKPLMEQAKAKLSTEQLAQAEQFIQQWLKQHR